MCTTVQLWVGKGEGSYCCALAWWERWEGENPRWRTMLVFCHPTHTYLKFFGSASNISGRLRQTFRRGVKHFSSAPNISALRLAKCWELINLTMTSPKTMTLPKTTTHIYEHFLCFCISQKLPVTKF